MSQLLLIVPAIVWLLVSGFFNALGEYFSKIWGNSPSFKLLVYVVLCYALSSILWLPALLHKNKLLIMGVSWVVIALLLTVLLGALVFKEHITFVQWLGIIFAFVSVVLLIR